MRPLPLFNLSPFAAAFSVMMQAPSPAGISLLLWVVGLIFFGGVFYAAQKFATKSLQVSVDELKKTSADLGECVIQLDKVLGERIGRLEHEASSLKSFMAEIKTSIGELNKAVAKLQQDAAVSQALANRQSRT